MQRMPKHGALKNLNYIHDAYQHIPEKANAMEEYLLGQRLRKHDNLKMFQLTRFQPNRWVQQKPPQLKEKPKQQMMSGELRRRMREGHPVGPPTPYFQNQIEKKRRKLQKEGEKLRKKDLLNDDVLRSRCYTKMQRRILSAVKTNVVKALDPENKMKKHSRRRSCSQQKMTVMSCQQSVEDFYETMFRTDGFKWSPRATVHHNSQFGLRTSRNK